MRNSLYTALIVLGSLFALTATSSAQRGEGPPKAGEPGKATVVNDAENVVASELVGTWVPQKDLNLQMGSRPERETGNEELEFRASDDAAKTVCAKLEVILALVQKDKGDDVAAALREAMQRIYWAGEVEFRRKVTKEAFPAALVVWRGNPHVLLYRSANGRDDLESFNIMVARHAKSEGDMLFVGGDSNKESFRAFTRKP